MGFLILRSSTGVALGFFFLAYPFFPRWREKQNEQQKKMRERTKRGKREYFSDLLILRVKNPASKLKLWEYFFREKIF